MELHLTPETEAKLNSLAQRTQRGTDELVTEAVDYLVGYNQWFEDRVRSSISAAEQGPLVSNDEVAAWLESQERR